MISHLQRLRNGWMSPKKNKYNPLETNMTSWEIHHFFIGDTSTDSWLFFFHCHVWIFSGATRFLVKPECSEKELLLEKRFLMIPCLAKARELGLRKQQQQIEGRWNCDILWLGLGGGFKGNVFFFHLPGDLFVFRAFFLDGLWNHNLLRILRVASSFHCDWWTSHAECVHVSFYVEFSSTSMKS